MKTLSHVSLTGPRGERGWGMLPHPRPRLPVGGELFPIYIPVGEETSPSPSPNRGIPRGESGIGSPLPSLLASLSKTMVHLERHIVFPLVYRLIELALLLPVATATIERAFSAMNIIKTELRNKISDGWLNDLMMC